MTICLVLICLLTFNVFKTFSADRNIYFFDIHDVVEKASKKNADTHFVVYEKDIKRITGDFDPRRFILQTNTIHDQLSIFSTWGDAVYFVKKNDNNSIEWNTLTTTLISENDFFEMDRFYTNKKKRKHISIYYYQPHYIEKESPKENKQANLIENGDIEMIGDFSQDKGLKKWIEQGATFYQDPNIQLPDFKYLLPTWAPPPQDYPKVCIDSKDVISGKRSLKVHFGKENPQELSLSSRFKSTPGLLSLKIKFLTPGFIQLRRYDYKDAGPITPPNSKFNFHFNDNDVHTIILKVDNGEYLGKTSIFTIYGYDVDFLIDDICFHPEQ